MYRFYIDNTEGRCYLRNKKGKIRWHKYGDNAFLNNVYTALQNFTYMDSTGIEILRDHKENIKRIIVDLEPKNVESPLTQSMRHFHNAGRSTLIDMNNFDSFTVKRYIFFMVLMQILESRKGIKFTPLAYRYKKHIKMSTELYENLKAVTPMPTHDLMPDGPLNKALRNLCALAIMYDKSRLEIRMNTVLSKLTDVKAYWEDTGWKITCVTTFCRDFFKSKQDEIPENFCEIMDRQLVMTKLSPKKRKKR